MSLQVLLHLCNAVDFHFLKKLPRANRCGSDTGLHQMVHDEGLHPKSEPDLMESLDDMHMLPCADAASLHAHHAVCMSRSSWLENERAKCGFALGIALEQPPPDISDVQMSGAQHCKGVGKCTRCVGKVAGRHHRRNVLLRIASF